MNDRLPQHLQDLLWRGELSADTRAQLEAWLQTHPESQDSLTAEAALTAALQRLSQAPVPSNFTAHVMEEIERADRPTPLALGRRRSAWWRLSGWLPRAAAVVLAVGLGWLGWQRHVDSERVQLTRSMVETVTVMPPEALEDFDTVRRLGDTGPDLKLLAALQ